MDNIKELIMHYLFCYDGCQTRTIQRICLDLCDRNYSESACRLDIIQGFKELEKEGKIVYIPFNKMTSYERKYFISDSSPIYRIIK